MTRPNLSIFTAIFIVGFFDSGFGGSRQEWGFVEVRPGAHMFWWLYFFDGSNSSTFQAKSLIIWHEGGPGLSSSGAGNFNKIGPLDGKQNPRNHSWVKDYHVLFVDSPVGTGFSYVKNSTLLCKTDAEVIEDLLTLMKHFYKKLPKFRNVPVYLLGESYGGKVVVEFAAAWHKNQKSSSNLGNLKGIAVGGAWISPIDSISSWAPYLLQIGLIDLEGYDIIQEKINVTIEAIQTGNWNAIDILLSSTLDFIWTETRGADFYNVLDRVSSKSLINGKIINFDSPETEREAMFAKFILSLITTNDLMNGAVRNNLGINRTWSGILQDVRLALSNDFAKPVTHLVESLLNETDFKIYVYNGQLDMMVPTLGTLRWIKRLTWRGAKKWNTSKRSPIIVNDIIEGYRKVYDNFCFYWVNRAGHSVPLHNPAAMSIILEELTKG